MRVATVFVLIVFSIIALCGAEDSSDSSISLLERETRDAASPVRQKKSKNGRKIKKKKNSKNSRKIKKKENSKTKKRNNKKGKGLRKNKLRKSKKEKKRKIKGKNEKKRRMKKGSNKRKSKAKNGNRKQKKVRKVLQQVERAAEALCLTADKEKKKRDQQRKVNRIDAWYSTMNKKAEKGGVFANYSKTLETMTDCNGNICEAAKNAYEFLSKCPETAKSACNTSDFEAKVNKITAECPVNCSMSTECKDLIKATNDGLKEIRDGKCLNQDFYGSFSNCMRFVKELGTDIIKDCVAQIKEPCDGTCSGIVEEPGSIIIELTDQQVPVISTNSPIRRSRKRLF